MKNKIEIYDLLLTEKTNLASNIMKGRSFPLLFLESVWTDSRKSSSSLQFFCKMPVRGCALRIRMAPELLSQLRAGILPFDLKQIGLKVKQA